MLQENTTRGQVVEGVARKGTAERKRLDWDRAINIRIKGFCCKGCEVREKRREGELNLYMTLFYVPLKLFHIRFSFKLCGVVRYC